MNQVIVNRDSVNRLYPFTVVIPDEGGEADRAVVYSIGANYSF